MATAPHGPGSVVRQTFGSVVQRTFGQVVRRTFGSVDLWAGG